jgi:hypothetical protein
MVAKEMVAKGDGSKKGTEAKRDGSNKERRQKGLVASSTGCNTTRNRLVRQHRLATALAVQRLVLWQQCMWLQQQGLVLRKA